MGGVVFAVAVLVVAESVVASFRTVGDFVPQVVLVAAFAVYDLAEQAFTHHLHYHQFVPVIAAVFQQHAVDAGLFIGVHQLPAVVQRIGAAHFGTGLLAAFHGVAAGGNVVFPCGGHHNHVHVGRFADFSVVQCDLGSVAVLFFHNLSSCSRPVFVGITYIGYANVFSLGENPSQVTHTTAAQPDNTNSPLCHFVLSPLKL